MLIRPELPSDYRAIGDINARAFDNRAAEAAIVALLRQGESFDPELSLVAEQDGKIVGHVLFTPYTIRLLGEDVEAVNLAPIAVHPDHQREGIGKALIEEGHRIAAGKGYLLSFLLGHKEYYPRFGYKTHSYGWSELVLPNPVPVESTLQTRPPLPDDLPALWRLWRYEEGDVDFAIDPGQDLLAWISPNRGIRSEVYLRETELVGYIRVRENDPAKPAIFLAADTRAAHEMADALSRLTPDGPLTLPLHPNSRSAQSLGEPKASAWAAGMALSLAPNPFDEYYGMVQVGDRPPGRVIWPVAFELA
jgi:putative acetyltransferase